MSTFRPSLSFSLLSSLLSLKSTMGLLDIVPAGVVTGDNLRKLLQYGMYYSDLDYFETDQVLT